MRLAELRRRSQPAAAPVPAPTPRAHRGPTHFSSLGEQLRAIARAEVANTVQDPRLGHLQRRASAAGASEQVPADGGFMIAPKFAKGIVERMYLTGEVFRRALHVPIEGTSFAFPQFDESSRATGSRFGGIQTFWEPEAGALLPAALQTAQKSLKPTIALSTLTTKKLAGYVYLTDELSLDSDAFDTWATLAFSSELLFTVEAAIIAGTGAGQPQGILNSPALIAVAKQSGQGSGTVESANISGMLAAFWAKSYLSPSAVWLYNQALLPQLSALTTAAGSGGSESKQWVWKTAADDYDRLCGIPALPSELCLYPGSTGDLLLVDLSRYMLAIREQLRGEVSIHVRFLTSESTFKFITRVDGQTIDRSPVSALNGGSPPYQTSPFVALAPR